MNLRRIRALRPFASLVPVRQHNRKRLRLGLLCLLATLSLGLGAVRADQECFVTDYIDCPVYARLGAPEDLWAARGPQASKLRVTWAIPEDLVVAEEGDVLDNAVLTVTVDDGETVVIENVNPDETGTVVYPVPAGGDLFVGAAWTRLKHIISDIQCFRLQAPPPTEETPPRPDPPPASPPDRPRTPPITWPRLPGVGGLTATAPTSGTDTDLDLDWAGPTNLEGIERFEIEICNRADCGGSPKKIGNPAPTATSHKVNDLKPNTEYYFRIRAIAGHSYRHSEWSNTAQGRTSKTKLDEMQLDAGAPEDETIIGSSVDLAVQAASTEEGGDDQGADKSVKLVWLAPSNIPDNWKEVLSSFEIQRCEDANCEKVSFQFQYNDITWPQVFKLIRENLERNTSYWYRIRAVAKSESDYLTSDWSNIASHKTAKTKLPAVTGFSVSSRNASTITLSWDSSPSEFDSIIGGFSILLCDDSSCDANSVKYVAKSATSTVVRSITSSRTYYFRIRVLATSGNYLNSDYTDTLTSTP